MPKIYIKDFGRALALVFGGVAIGYCKCLVDVKKAYGDVIEDECITVKPNKMMSVGITNSPKENEESN